MKKERITAYFEYKGYKSAKAFAKVLKISDSHITEIDKRNKNTTLINGIRSKSEFSDCNIDWILTGEGEMLLNKFQQFSESRRATLASEQPPGIQPEQRLVAVTNQIRPTSEAGWELLDYFDVLCPEQKQALLGVAKAMAAGVPAKSSANAPTESGLPAVNANLK